MWFLFSCDREAGSYVQLCVVLINLQHLNFSQPMVTPQPSCLPADTGQFLDAQQEQRVFKSGLFCLL